VRRHRILLTGIGGNTAQGVARSLLLFPQEFSLIGSDSDQYNCKFGRRYCERVYMVPRAQDENYIRTIARIIEKEKIDLVIPSPDPEVYALSRQRDQLKNKLFLPDHRVIELTQDKWLTYEALKNKVRQPESYLPEGPGDIAECFSDLKPPCWVRMRRGAGGSRSFIANSAEQAKFWVEYWKGYGQFIISEFLAGRNLSWIGLYREGELVSSGGYDRLRYFMEHVSPTGVTGNSSVAMTIHDDRLNDAAEAAVESVDAEPNGAYTVDLKENEEPLVTEFNSGRFHMSFYTYTAAGLNLPYYYVKLALDEPFDPPPKRNGLREGVITIRNTDNGPVYVPREELGKDALTIEDQG